VAARPNPPKRIPEVATEMWDLSLAYAKQETVDPLKGLGRFLGSGVPGALALAVGSILLLLAALRAMQTETGSTFTGNLSWIPYLLVTLLGALLSAIVMWRIVKRKGPGL
jgi:hypothetical protein